uniref:Thrombomodulin n=1 Tax=Oryzias latipes TaxID=8090 RepID=A0A3P9HZW2_ORYLA
MRLFILCLQLICSFQALFGSQHETLCTSNTCFTFHMEKANFSKAHQSCTNNGGQLMTIRDKHEEDVLQSLLSRIQRESHSKPPTFWIGLKLHKKDCVVHGKPLRGFKWVSGEEDSSYSNWKKNPPLTCTTDRCVMIDYTFSVQDQLKWRARGCGGHAFYACKFYFQGMCQPLALHGPGHISYIAPFSKNPQKSKMNLLPKGTYSEITCSDQQSHYSVCMELSGTFSWTNPGPFCKLEMPSYSVLCSCKDGYDLDEDAFSCRIGDLCRPDTCEYQCVMGVSGFFCRCPQGFHLDANLRTCSDIDECQLQTCEGHECVNTPGSYKCVCRDGYEMLDGECRDIDECKTSTCEHSCLNYAGSFSCRCNDGFIPDSSKPRSCKKHCAKERCQKVCEGNMDSSCSCPEGYIEDENFCVDINECASNWCQQMCKNTFGSYECSCREGFVPSTKGKCIIKAEDSEGWVSSTPATGFVKPATKNNPMKSSSVPAGAFLWVWVVVAGFGHHPLPNSNSWFKTE